MLTVQGTVTTGDSWTLPSSLDSLTGGHARRVYLQYISVRWKEYQHSRRYVRTVRTTTYCTNAVEQSRNCSLAV